MNFLSNNLLSGVDHLSGRLGPITVLIDSMVNRIVPKATAQASCPGPGYCYTACSTTCCANCSGDYRSIVYAYYGYRCTQRCIVNCDYC